MLVGGFGPYLTGQWGASESYRQGKGQSLEVGRGRLGKAH